MPEGHVIGTRGDHWNNHPAPKDPAAFAAFVNAYRQKFNEYPIYPCTNGMPSCVSSSLHSSSVLALVTNTMFIPRTLSTSS